MKVIIAGSSGMIGNLVLTHCLNSDQVTQVISLVRQPTNLKNPKLNEVVIPDFEDYSLQENLFKEVNTAFFCIGAYTGQVPDDLFKKITVNYAVEFAKAVAKNSPGATLCLLSGAGADRTEKSKTAFARYKGMAENQISKLDLQFYSLRPAYIYPVESRKEPNLAYRIFRALYPVIKLFGNQYTIKSTELAQAIFQVGLHRANQPILENKDILEYVGRMDKSQA